jgi:predicted MPP superfamily phosphohydrolase
VLPRRRDIRSAVPAVSRSASRADAAHTGPETIGSSGKTLDFRRGAWYDIRDGRARIEEGMLMAAEAIVFLLGAMALLAIVIGCGYALFILPTQWLKVERIEQPLGLNVTMLQLSDLHVEKLRIKPGRIAKLIRREKPDYIVVTGDFTQKESRLPQLRPYLEVLRDSGVPVYAVLGNHDYQMRKVIRLVKLLQEHDIRLLRNENVRLDKFQLIGIDDFDSGKSNISRAFSGVASGPPRIVITHDPNIVLHLEERYDYLMAGHLHGKQLNVPFFFRLRPMGKLPAMGIYKGLHRSSWGTYYISKGLGQTMFNIRLFVRSEATVHRL